MAGGEPAVLLRDVILSAAKDLFLDRVASEMASGEPGFETIVSRLADILVVQAVRAHVAQTGGGCKGWLRALVARN